MLKYPPTLLKICFMLSTKLFVDWIPLKTKVNLYNLELHYGIYFISSLQLTVESNLKINSPYLFSFN